MGGSSSRRVADSREVDLGFRRETIGGEGGDSYGCTMGYIGGAGAGKVLWKVAAFGGGLSICKNCRSLWSRGRFSTICLALIGESGSMHFTEHPVHLAGQEYL